MSTILVCPNCDGKGMFRISGQVTEPCEPCCGIGFFGIDPWAPCPTLSGSPLKQGWLVARYAAGCPLWHPDDAHLDDDSTTTPDYRAGESAEQDQAVDDELEFSER